MRTASQQRVFNARYYAAHRTAEIARVRLRQNATLEFLRDLRRRPCADCDEEFPPWAMDFDHRDPSTKWFSLTTGRALLMSRPALIAEIAKCDVVCANCHAERTYRYLTSPTSSFRRRQTGTSRRLAPQRERWRTQAALLRQLRAGPCADCAREFPFYVMQFDHRDASAKAASVTRMIGRASTERIVAEAAKCDVVCSNCHRIRTYERRRLLSSSEATNQAGVA